MSKGPKTLTDTNRQTNSGTSTLALDPIEIARQNDLYDRATALADRPYTPFTGQRFADFNPDQQAAFAAGRGAAGAGIPELDAASQGFSATGGFQPPSVQFGGAGVTTAGNPYLVNPLAMGGPVQTSGVGARDVTSRDISAQTLPEINRAAYINPYTNEVVNTSLADIERARQEAAANTRSQALGEGAFGGSRSGVAEALGNRDFARQAATTAAGLRAQGFDTASGLMSADANRTFAASQANQEAALRAALGNQNADLSGSATNAGNALTAGLANRNNLLSLFQGNQNAANRAAEFNANALNQGGQFNATGVFNAGLANAGNALSGAGLRMGAFGALAGLAGQRQNMGAFGADLLSRIGGAQQGLDQANKDFGYQQFQEARNLPYQNLDLLSRLQQGLRYGQTITQNSSSSGTSTRPNPNRGSLFSNVLGLAGMIPGIGGLVGKGLSALGIGRGSPNPTYGQDTPGYNYGGGAPYNLPDLSGLPLGIAGGF